MYNLQTRDGTLEIPDGTIIEYKGLEIVGQDKEYWNRPIQQNFVEIADSLEEIRNLSKNSNGDIDCGGANSVLDLLDLGSASSMV